MGELSLRDLLNLCTEPPGEYPGKGSNVGYPIRLTSRVPQPEQAEHWLCHRPVTALTGAQLGLCVRSQQHRAAAALLQTRVQVSTPGAPPPSDAV